MTEPLLTAPVCDSSSSEPRCKEREKERKWKKEIYLTSILQATHTQLYLLFLLSISGMGEAKLRLHLTENNLGAKNIVGAKNTT